MAVNALTINQRVANPACGPSPVMQRGAHGSGKRKGVRKARSSDDRWGRFGKVGLANIWCVREGVWRTLAGRCQRRRCRPISEWDLRGNDGADIWPRLHRWPVNGVRRAAGEGDHRWITIQSRPPLPDRLHGLNTRAEEMP